MWSDIPDGYSEAHSINGVAILLRPFTRCDRKAIGAYLHGLSDVMAHRAERRLVLSRVVDCDGDVDDLYGERLWELAMGVHNRNQEITDEENLSRGVFVVTRYPWMERTSCAQCRKWLWNPLNGQLHRNAGGPPLQRRGEPPCEPSHQSVCPRGHWSNPVELSPKNKLAWLHYQAHAATQTFPDDPIVRRNVRLIQNAIELARQDQSTDGRAGGRSQPARQLRHAGVGGRARTAGDARGIAGTA